MIRRTNADLNPMSAIIDYVSLNVGTIGPEHVGVPVMLTGMVKNDPRIGGEAQFYDLFLTVAHCELLLAALPDVIERAKAWEQKRKEEDE